MTTKANDSIDKIIGIPRAMSYYTNYPFYYGFFNSLGIEVVLSDKTTACIVNSGVERVVSDTCFPIKVFVGHVVNLLEKGCNTIFIPSLQSTSYKINNCSKIRGLPEIIRNVIDVPFKMIEPTLDKTEGLGLYDFFTNVANEFGIYDNKVIKQAINAGWLKYDNFIKMTNSGVSYDKALNMAINGITVENEIEDIKPLSIVIMAHGYNLYDERISLRLISKLEKMGVKPYTSLNLDIESAKNALNSIGEIQYWANELELTATAAYYMLNKKIDGIIALSAFGCGPDSLMVDEINYHANQKNIPMLHLTVDEHTGEAGFVTRLEAFVDMLLRKKRKQLESDNKYLCAPIAETENARILTNIQ